MSDGGSRASWAAGAAVALGIAASVGLAVYVTSKRLAHTRLPSGPDVVHLEVTARSFSWDVRHPGPDGVLGTSDDVLRTDEMHVPVGRPVVVHLRTRDLVHGLFLPAYGVHQDVSPAREAAFWFRAPSAMRSQMVCSQLCGAGHYTMQGVVVAEGPEGWARWNGARAAGP